MAPAVSATTPANQAERLKQDGNSCFKKCRFGAAIDAYTEAIALCPNVAVYWTNRALCHRKRNDWKKCEEDCSRAIQLDHSSVKGHYMLGLALLERSEFSEGVRQLEKALDLGRGSSIVEEIWQELSKAKYLEWEDKSSKHLWELQTLKEACESALEEKLACDISMVGLLDQSAHDNSKQLSLLEHVFMEAARVDIPTEVPDYLCCKITLDVFRDPVIAPSGVTYERAAILHHLQKVGDFDPFSREPLKETQLVSNLAIKDAVQAFLDKHGWAYRMG